MFTNRRCIRFFSAIAMLGMVFANIQSPSASAQTRDGIKRQFNTETGKVSFIGPENGQFLSASQALGIPSDVRPDDPAMALAQRFGQEFGLVNPERDLTKIQVNRPGDGRVTVHYQQNYQGIPVMGGELIVNTNGNGDLYSINGEVSSEIPLPTQPTIDSEQARQSALQAVAKWYWKTPADLVASRPVLWIFDESLLQPSTRRAELVWRLEVTPIKSGNPIRELVLVNAHRGSISMHFNQVDTAWQQKNHEAGLLRTGNNGPVSYVTALAGSAGFQLSDGMQIQTYTAGNSTSLPGTFLCDQRMPNCTDGGDLHADTAHQHAIGTYSLYLDQYNRNGIDGNNMLIISTVHFDTGYANAFWNGSQMVYGDGYGFALADDVVAHELTHGVTQYESNLFYYYQSGAINESFSDLWGEYYDQTNGQGNDAADVKWLMGEDISGLGAIRDMSNPPAFNDPDKMSSVNYYKGVEDSGGVHINSGVNNKAVSLMVDGGTFNGITVSALGWIKTAAIYYEAQTNLLSSGADYSDLYFALQQACSNLIGQKDINAGNCTAVKDAADAVEMNTQPAPNFNPDAPLCSTGFKPSVSFVDDLETGAANWTFTNGDATRWQVDSPYGPYAQSGIHSLYADDYPVAITDASARLASFIVPDNAYLHFAQAFDFESLSGLYYFDGGVLEYSTDDGSTWLDAGPLIDFNGYNGTIYDDWNNPLKGRSGFVGTSHGYISARLNLASLAGQTVTFRWRMGLDDTGYAGGWWLDNIRVYKCEVPNLDVFIGGILMDNYYVPGSSSHRASYAGLDNGPVKVTSTNGIPIVASERVAYSPDGGTTWTSHAELMGLPEGQLASSYTFPWYNNLDLNSQIRFGNVGTASTSVKVFIGGVLKGTYALTPNQSKRVSFAGLDAGPVKIQSSGNVPIIASIRVAYFDGSNWTSFSELMGLPSGQLTTSYTFPWYNNLDLNSQIRFGNVGTANTFVKVFVGGVLKGTYPLLPNQSKRVSYSGLDKGPVKIQSSGNVPIIASIRVAYNDGSAWTDYSEIMGLPTGSLSTMYNFPVYDNVQHNSQLRFGNVGTAGTTVEVFINGVSQGTYPLAPNQSKRISYAGLDSGPVVIQSSGGVPIIASLRVAYFDGSAWTSFAEMMGLPQSQLATTYIFPWYNNLDLDTQLRFGVP